jgi:hypothetical protein
MGIERAAAFGRAAVAVLVEAADVGETAVRQERTSEVAPASRVLPLWRLDLYPHESRKNP